MRSTATPIEDLAARQGDYVAALHRSFFRTLSRAACEDVVADVFAQACASPTCGDLQRPALDLWLKTAIRHRAIDVLRARQGQGAVRREAELDISELTQLRGAEDVQADDDSADLAAFMAAYRRLPARDQQILGLRHFDNLQRDVVARMLGLSLDKYKRRYTQARRRLVDVVIATAPHDTCPEARALINLSTHDRLDLESAARRDAHVAGCPHCRQYQRHSRGLLVLTPIPATALADRLLSRLHAVAERFLPFLPTADAASTPGTARGAGALGAGGLKLAAVLVSGAVAVGGGTAAVHRTHPNDRVQAATKTGPVVSSAPQVPISPASYARRPAAATVTEFAPRSARSTAAEKSATKSTSSRASSGGELKPPGNEVTRASSRAKNAVSGPLLQQQTTTSARTKPSGVAVSVPTPADSSSGEFAPQP